jgi:FkbM family methyltransferase
MEELVVVRPTGHGFELEVPARIAPMYTGVGYERLSMALFERACAQADVVVDIGAHIGLFSLVAHQTNPAARVIAVEASPENAAVATRNVQRLHADSIEVVCGVFGGSHGAFGVELTEASDNCGRTGHPDSPTVQHVEVEGVTGADLGIADGQHVVIKVDVDGHELDVLAGLEQVIAHASDIRVLIEFNPNCLRAAGAEPRDLLAWWLDRDFRVFMIDDAAGTWSELREASDAVEELVGLRYPNLLCLRADATRSVAAVMHSGALNGAERSHVELVEDLVTSGWMVHTIVPGTDGGLVGEVQRGGGSAAVVEGWPWWVPAVDVTGPVPEDASWVPYLVHPPLIRELAKLQPDVVLTQTTVVAQGAIAACALGLPHVWYLHELAAREHGLQLPLAAPEVGRVLTALSDRVIAISETVARHFFPLDPDAVDVVHSAPRGARTGAHCRPPEHGNDVWTLGIIGSLQIGKGHADVIAAVAQLAERGIDMRLQCIGTGNPADVQRLEQLAADLGVAERVVLAGKIVDRSNVYAGLDAVVMASPREGFSRIPFEAADAGVPLIYVDGGRAGEPMLPGETGLAYAVGDIASMAEAIEVLALDADAAHALAARAKKHLDTWRADPQRLARLRAALSVERQGGAEGLLREMIGAVAARAAHAEADSVARQSLTLERDALVHERDSVVAERDAIALERDTAILDRDAVGAERAEFAESLDAIQTSRVWRWSTPYRQLRSRVR